MDTAYAQIIGGWSLPSALSWAGAAFDADVDIASFSSISDSYLAGTYVGGDSFAMWGSHLTAFPTTTTQMDYTFNPEGITASLFGSVNTYSDYSQSGYINKISVSSANFGLIEVTGYNDILSDGALAINSVDWAIGGATLSLTGALTGDTAVVGGQYQGSVSGTYTGGTLNYGGQSLTINNVTVDANTTFLSVDAFLRATLAGNDLINGTASGNWLSGYAGDDTIIGGAGNDRIVAGLSDGNDTISGGADYDILDFSPVGGVVQVNQLAGATTGSAGNDTLLDHFEEIIGTSFADILIGSDTTDVLNGGAGNDKLYGNKGSDTYRGDAGDDTFYFSDSDGDDSLAGGLGFDTLDFSGLNGVVQANQFSGVTTGTAGNDTLVDIFEMLIGTRFGDVLAGGYGGDGLKGGAGNDQMWGNGGDDWMSGGDGNDRLKLGQGNDTVDFRNGDDIDTIVDFTAGAGSVDKLQFKNYLGLGTASLAGLQSQGRITQVGADTQIALNGGDMVILMNVLATNLHADDFIFA